jgi:4-hydroxy-3-polyprenylbenzoate decarboxylase
VSTHEPLTSLHKLIIVVVDREDSRAPKSGVRCMASRRSVRPKASGSSASTRISIPDDTDAVFWAMSYRCKPHNDVEILKHKHEGHGPRSLLDSEDSAVLIDATLKETFPPVSLPKREFMEKAKKIWEELGLPKLKPKAPWFGYDMGEWNSPVLKRWRAARSKANIGPRARSSPSAAAATCRSIPKSARWIWETPALGTRWTKT